MTKIIIKIIEDQYPCSKRERLRFVPFASNLMEQTAPVAPSPQYRCRPQGELLMGMQIKDSEQVDFSMKFKDKKGNPTNKPDQDTITWGVDNTDLLSVTPSADGLTCTVKAVGPLGTGTVSVILADENNNNQASGSIEVEVISGAPVNIELVPGTPTEQP